MVNLQKFAIQISLSKWKFFFGKRGKSYSFNESMIMKEYLPIVPFFFESSEFSRNLRFSHLYQDSNKKISRNFLILLGIKYLEIGGVKDHSREQKKQANLRLGRRKKRDGVRKKREIYIFFCLSRTEANHHVRFLGGKYIKVYLSR